MPPRIFVSSVMEPFQEYRQAARNGIIKTGGEPVLIEDYPGLSISSRNACLDAVVSCDVFIVIVGKRGGWTTPSGKLVVEEEYEEALRRKLHVLAFIQNTDRDEEAQRFVAKISDYIDGVFRPTFNSPAELQTAVEKALIPIIQHYKKSKIELAMIEEKLNTPHRISSETCLRFVVSPERVEEFIDPVMLDSPELKRQLFEIGHSPQVELFSYSLPKDNSVEVDGIIILQSSENRRQSGVDEVRLELSTQGIIAIDLNVTGHEARDVYSGLSASMILSEADIILGLKKSFAFVRAFFEARDPYKRYDRMLYNTALSGIGHRTLMARPQPMSSYTLGNHGDGVVRAFERPRLITRVDLEKHEEQVEAALTLFRRRLKQ